MLRITQESVERNILSSLLRASGKQPAAIELCRIEEVDTTNKVVSAYFFSTGKIRPRVPYCLPFYNNGYGIIINPTKGALGVATWDSSGEPLILTFTAPLTVNEEGHITRNFPHFQENNFPLILEGELLFSSVGRSILKLDKLGGFTLASSVFAYINVDEDGNYTLDAETSRVSLNGTSEEIYTTGENYEPYLKITKGRHLSEATQYTKGGVELCYSLGFITNNKINSCIGIGMDGNIYYSGKILNLDSKEIGGNRNSEAKIRRRKRKRVTRRGTKRRHDR